MAVSRILSIVVGFGAIAEVASEQCAGSLEVEEVSQLQHTLKKGPTKCYPTCKNKGSCIHGFCHCVPGFAGEDCGTVAELAVSQNFHDGCGNSFTVYPYIQPQLWGTYDGWELCGTGKEQTPIDIRTCKSLNAKPLNISFKSLDNPPRINNGHSIEYEGDFLEITIGKTGFRSSQFHFHTPSEHRIKGYLYAFEMHVVTLASDGGIAVIGILFKLGKRNKCLDNLLKKPLPGAGCQDHVGPIDLQCFQDQLSGPYWTYDGSLTTPPCTEGLKWNVMKRVATMSWRQLMAFKTRYVMNARPVQPLHGRNVYENKVWGGGWWY